MALPSRQVAWRNTWGWPESLALAGYMVIVALGLAWHEPWADEAQAWLIARDMGWTAMVLHGVRYEGSPALWHSILWVLVRLHVSFTAMRWIGGAFAAAGTAVFIGCAPFFRLLRLLLPFTFFLAYQQAVIARSYVLVGLLAFGAAALLRWSLLSARPTVLALSLLLGLLANVSVHGFVLSTGLAAIAFMVWRQQRVPRSQWWPGLAMLLAFWLAAVATTAPPVDVNFPAGRNLARSWSKLSELDGKRKGAMALARGVDPEAGAVLPGELAPFVPPPVRRRGDEHLRLVRLLSLVTFPFSNYRVVGLAALLALVAVALRERNGLGLAALLPYGTMLLVFQALYMAPRHASTLLVGFLVSAWLAWPVVNFSAAPTLVLSGILLLVCVQQIGWTARAVWLDVHGPYAANPITADFLRGRIAAASEDRLAASRNGQVPKVAGFYYHSIGVLPYFTRNIYENQPAHAYWDWSTRNRIDARAPFELLRRPDYVVVSGWTSGPDEGITVDWAKPEEADGPQVPLADSYGVRTYFLAHGYRETHRFCGWTWMRDAYAEELCDVVLEPMGPA